MKPASPAGRRAALTASLSTPLRLAPIIVPLLLLPLSSLAMENSAKKDPAHNTRRSACSKEAHAKGLKGDERKKYISTCVASTKAAKTPAQASPTP